MKKVIFALAAVGLASAANAQFYGGDFDGENGLSSEKNTIVSDSYVFDNFNWGGGNVATVFGNFLQTGLSGGVAGGEFEIRSGVSQGNGGVLVHSGSAVMSWVKKGPGGFGLEEWTLTLDGGNFALAAGTYWVGVRPVGFNNGSERAFVSSTSGAGGIGGPLNDNNSFFHSSFFGFNYEKVENVLGTGMDFSLGLTVPAPGAMSLLGLGGLLAARRRR
jgi:hypothetical protein